MSEGLSESLLLPRMPPTTLANTWRGTKQKREWAKTKSFRKSFQKQHV